jgi:hypothetical protein
MERRANAKQGARNDGLTKELGSIHPALLPDSFSSIKTRFAPDVIRSRVRNEMKFPHAGDNPAQLAARCCRIEAATVVPVA